MVKNTFFSMIFFCLFLPAAAMAAYPGFMVARMGILGGKILVEEKAVPNSIIAFFDITKGLPPITKGMGRVPEFLGATNDAGQFAIKLLPGTYYMGILLRKPGITLGPPTGDEKYYFANDGQNNLRKFTIANYEQNDIGEVTGSLPEVFKEIEDIFTVQGILLDGDSDNPHEGAMVLAKENLKQIRPDFISEKTVADGLFTLKLLVDKSYYLTARQSITGAQPNSGEKIGTYGIDSFTAGAFGERSNPGSPPPGVTDEVSQKNTGETATVRGSKGKNLSGIIIRMYEVPDRQSLQEQTKAAAGAAVFEEGAALNNLFFEYNSAKISEISFKELDQWIKFLANRNDVVIELIGHTDNVGSKDFNLLLSQKRAQAVAQYLSGHGINPERIKVSGLGESMPLADNSTEEGRSKNRRVEIKFDK